MIEMTDRLTDCRRRRRISFVLWKDAPQEATQKKGELALRLHLHLFFGAT